MMIDCNEWFVVFFSFCQLLLMDQVCGKDKANGQMMCGGDIYGSTE
jgi:hypothetical protein